MTEPRITIEGVELSEGQAMTVRVALQSYAMDLHPKDSLGTDEHGRAMRAGYLARIREINEIVGASEARRRREP